MKKFNLENTVRQLLTPQEVLAPWLFDANNVMLSDVRDDLLKIADFFVAQTVGDIAGLEVYDVTLTGSCSGYHYRQSSDIDLRIEIHNENCKELAKDKKHFEKFLSAQTVCLLHNGEFMKYKGRFVDVKLSCYQIDFVSLYSIKNNKWLVYPEKDFKVTEDEMTAYYEKRRKAIKDELIKIRRKYKGIELGRQLYEFYGRVVSGCYSNGATVKDRIVFKLLNEERILKPIGAESILAYNDAFSLKF